jgi:CxxC motif-containing protein
MKNITCIVCPKGCKLFVNEKNNFEVSGNLCSRGAVYGKNEVQNPMREVSSTVLISGAHIAMLPVKTNGEIPKNLVCQAVMQLNNVCIKAPVNMGDVVLKNVLNTGVDFVASRSL